MLQLKFFCLFIAFISHNCSMFKYIHIQFGLTMYFTINKDSFFYLRHMVFTLYRRQSVQSEFPFISLQTWHKFGSTSRNCDKGRKEEEEGGGVPRGVSSRPTHNHPWPQLHKWLPTPFSSPPPIHTLLLYPLLWSVQYSVFVSHISSTSKSNIFHLLIPVWVFETEDRMVYTRVTQVRLVKFFIRKTEKTKCKLIKFLFEFKTRGECQPLTP